MQIRFFDQTDSEDLFEYLNRVSIQTNNLGLEQQELQSSFNPEKLKHLNDKLQASIAFIAQDDRTTKIIGLAQITRKLRIRYMNQAEFAISVDKKYWSQHIGSKLIEACVAWATEKWNIEGIYLEVLSDNRRAINLYKKYGFTIVGDLPILLTIDGQNKPGKLMFKHLKK